MLGAGAESGGNEVSIILHFSFEVHNNTIIIIAIEAFYKYIIILYSWLKKHNSLNFSDSTN